MFPSTSKPEADEDVVTLQLDGFTFTTRHGAPAEIVVEAQAVDQYGEALPAIVPVTVWLTSSPDGDNVSTDYLNRRTFGDDRRAGCELRAALGVLFGVDEPHTIVRLLTTAEGKFAVRFVHAPGTGSVRVAAIAGPMFQPSVSRKLERADFGPDKPRTHPLDPGRGEQSR